MQKNSTPHQDTDYKNSYGSQRVKKWLIWDDFGIAIFGLKKICNSKIIIIITSKT